MKRRLLTVVATVGLAVAFLLIGPAACFANLPQHIVEAKDAISDVAASDTLAVEDVTAAGISVRDAQRAFDAMAHQRDIAFRYVPDGCYARAFLMIGRMQRMGLQPIRVWSFPAAGGSLRVATPLVKRGYVDWGYHVAPAIPVTYRGRTTYMVIDPSLFRGPATVAQWRNMQRNTRPGADTLIRLTRLGQAPVLASGRRAAGSGYWPSLDPAEGKPTHAMRTMQRFKGLEPALLY